MKLSVKGKDPISLAGEWKYLSGLSLSGIPPVPISPESNPKYPTGLFNAMIHPLTSFPLQGVIWYQGKSNLESSDEYADLFMSLIADWRDGKNHKCLSTLCNCPIMRKKKKHKMIQTGRPCVKHKHRLYT